MPVDKGNAEYAEFLPKWQRCRDARSGSDAVKSRDGGKAYLPPLPSHATDDTRYQEYKLRALFYNATGRTIEGLGGAIFQKAPTFTVAERYKGDLRDVTLSGVSAESFCLEQALEILTTARAGILVDMPAEPTTTKAPGGAGVSKVLRPYWAAYLPESILDWRTERRGADEVLTHLRLAETPEEPDQKDRFATICRRQIRVLDLTPEGVYTQTLYREKLDASGKPTKDWVQFGGVIVPVRRKEPLGFIPFVFASPIGTSPEPEKPPLEDLVDVNLSHYRGTADLKHGLHCAALPTPWVAGLAGGEPKGGLSIGSSKAWVLDVNGKAGMLEVQGPGFESIRTDLQDMQKMMATLGARLLEEQPTSSETMGAVGMRHAGEHATLRTIAGAIEQALSLVLQFHVWWMGTEATPADVKASVELNKDYFQVKAAPEQVRAALLSVQAGEMSSKTFYHVLQTGDWTREGITAEQEKEDISREGEPPTQPNDVDANADLDVDQDPAVGGEKKDAAPGGQAPPFVPFGKKPGPAGDGE
jgi:hypothetical protein